MNRLAIIAIVVALAFYLASGCERIVEPVVCTVPIRALLSAPEQITIDSRNFVLQTYLWRDFMPVCPPDGRPLIAWIAVSATDSGQFPSSTDADWLWVVKDHRHVWEAGLSEEHVPREPDRRYQLPKIARDGPKWGPGIQVDVVLRVVDRKNKAYLLRASNQWIHRTD